MPEANDPPAPFDMSHVTPGLEIPAPYIYSNGPPEPHPNVSCDMGNPIHEVAVASSAFCGTLDLPNPEQLGLGAFDVNWMSPQYPTDINWEALLAGFAADDHWFGMQGETFNQGERSQQDASAPALTGVRNTMMQRSREALPPDMDRESIPSGHAQVSPSSPSSIKGRYYVDSDGARAPFGGRSYQRGSLTAVQRLSSPESDAITPLSPRSMVDTGLCPQGAYENLIQGLLSENQAHALSVDLASVPSQVQIQLYVRQYFDRFHPVFPILRKSSFPHVASNDWLLLLAVATVGAKYARRMQGKEPGAVLWGLLDTVLERQKFRTWTQLVEGNDDAFFVPSQESKPSTRLDMSTMQVGIIHILLLLHSGKKSLVERAIFERHHLVES
jgi:hypothetical protein